MKGGSWQRLRMCLEYHQKALSAETTTTRRTVVLIPHLLFEDYHSYFDIHRNIEARMGSSRVNYRESVTTTFLMCYNVFLLVRLSIVIATCRAHASDATVFGRMAALFRGPRVAVTPHSLVRRWIRFRVIFACSSSFPCAHLRL